MTKRILLHRSIHAALAALASLSIMTVVATAAEPPPKNIAAPITKETREKMAVLHEQMAACLRSDKAIEDCHAEMRKNCMASLGEHGCPMMGMRMHSHRKAPPGTP